MDAAPSLGNVSWLARHPVEPRAYCRKEVEISRLHSVVCAASGVRCGGGSWPCSGRSCIVGPAVVMGPRWTQGRSRMSYVIHIWEEPVPTSLEHAEELIGELIRAPRTAEPNPKYVEAAKRLTAKYPFEEDPGADPEGEVWSDGPLTPRRGERL